MDSLRGRVEPCSSPLQSLANVLVVLRRRLGELQKAPHTNEDLQHFRVGWRAAATPRAWAPAPAARGAAGGSTAADGPALQSASPALRAAVHCARRRRSWTTWMRAGGMPRAPLRGGLPPLTPRLQASAPASSTSATARCRGCRPHRFAKHAAGQMCAARETHMGGRRDSLRVSPPLPPRPASRH